MKGECGVYLWYAVDCCCDRGPPNGPGGGGKGVGVGGVLVSSRPHHVEARISVHLSGSLHGTDRFDCRFVPHIYLLVYIHIPTSRYI